MATSILHDICAHGAIPFVHCPQCDGVDLARARALTPRPIAETADLARRRPTMIDPAPHDPAAVEPKRSGPPANTGDGPGHADRMLVNALDELARRATTQGVS